MLGVFHSTHTRRGSPGGVSEFLTAGTQRPNLRSVYLSQSLFPAFVLSQLWWSHQQPIPTYVIVDSFVARSSTRVLGSDTWMPVLIIPGVYLLYYLPGCLAASLAE